MGLPPHKVIAQRREQDARYDAECAQAEATYGLPIDKIPPVLRSKPPEHPARRKARRFDYRAQDSWRVWRMSRLPNRFGWRTERRLYLKEIKRRRQAEIVMRQLHAKHTGRGRPLDRKAHVDARRRIEDREWREE